MILTQEERSLRSVIPTKLHTGLDRAMNNTVGRYHRRRSLLTQGQREAENIHARSLQLQNLTKEELQHQLADLRIIFRRQARDHEQHLAEAIAMIVEASERCLGMRPYPVQILGALIIYRGGLAEMATGEGKSLTAALPAILTAWSGRPCHIITTNDYLASRDAEELAPLYNFCLTTTGWVGSSMSPELRRGNYASGVVYTTSKELLADFLRDRLLLGNCHQVERRRVTRKLKGQDRAMRQMVMRGIDTVIVDEADSVLIDEAVTPLLISQPQKNRPLTEACKTATELAKDFIERLDYQVEQRYREVQLTHAGEAKLEKLCVKLPDLWQGKSRREELLILALTAKELYHKGRQYVIEDDKVVIVDEFTGRMMPQRTWRHGLHQMIEAKEDLTLSDPSETLVRLSFQRFFRFFRKLGGMSGTAVEAADEFWHIYGMPVFSVPTNRPCVRKQLPVRFCSDQKSKWQAICDEVIDCHRLGQPVLIGTRSIADSEKIATLLSTQGVPFQILNAIKHREEAEIIATAGQRGIVTIATNMAGRGADIKLQEDAAELGGLHVIVSEPHESKRIDRQLLGRSGRQGAPGTGRIFSCSDDEILQRYVSKPLLMCLHNKTLRRYGTLNQSIKTFISLAQHKAEKQAFRQRKTVMQTDTWISDALSFVRSDIDKTI